MSAGLTLRTTTAIAMLCAAIIATTLAACGGGAGTATVTPATVAASPSPAATGTPPAGGRTGIDGLATIGPTCPVERVDSPCPDRPYEASVTVLKDGAQVAQTRADAGGRFVVLLAPGTYEVVGASGDTFPHEVRQTVTVVAGRLTPVHLMFDSGIR